MTNPDYECELCLHSYNKRKNIFKGWNSFNLKTKCRKKHKIKDDHNKKTPKECSDFTLACENCGKKITRYCNCGMYLCDKCDSGSECDHCWDLKYGWL